MKILIACEYSATVREAFKAKGHDVTSCDLLDTDIPGKHHKGDVLDIIDDDWDMMIAHPPCTYICSSGLHWNKRRPERALLTEEALDFVTMLWHTNIEKVMIENPVGCINTRLAFMPKPQYVQPYMFGDDASKKTGLWKRGLPDLVGTCAIEPRIVVAPNGREYKRWGNQLDSGQNNVPNNANRAHVRNKTFPGLAAAMASQWG